MHIWLDNTHIDIILHKVKSKQKCDFFFSLSLQVIQTVQRVLNFLIEKIAE